MQDIQFQPVTRANWLQCLRLRPRPDQLDFIASNEASIAEAYVKPFFTPLAICAGGEVVGFTLYGVVPDDGVCWIQRFMIGGQHQGRGYGKAALQLLLKRIEAEHGEVEVRLSYVPANEVAGRLYATQGFELTGEADVDGEVVARWARRQGMRKDAGHVEAR